MNEFREFDDFDTSVTCEEYYYRDEDISDLEKELIEWEAHQDR